MRNSKSPLHQIEWYRVVLDEGQSLLNLMIHVNAQTQTAHVIRHRLTRQYQAVMSLSSCIRWCLTGTPIQNSIDDAHALVQFLRTPPLDSLSVWRRLVTDPLRNGEISGLNTLRQLLGCLCLRRTRDVLVLPNLSLQIRSLTLSQQESMAYNQIKSDLKERIEIALSGPGQDHTVSSVLQGILRLRSLCNHGLCTKYHMNSITDGSSSSKEESFALLQLIGETSCVRCTSRVDTLDEGEGLASGVMTSCAHLICRPCLDRDAVSLVGTVLNCPLCNQATSVQSQLSIIDNSALPMKSPDNLQSSDSYVPTKISRLVEEVVDRMNDGKWYVISTTP